MEDTEKKSFDFACDVTKQLITLSTGIITICIAFADKIFTRAEVQSHSVLFVWALCIFVVSILFGLLTQLKMTGIIANWKKRKDKRSAIYDGATRVLSGLQILSFFIAVVLSLIFVSKSAHGEVPTPEMSHSCCNNNVLDTLVIKVECCNSCGRNVTTKKSKVIKDSCIKYIRVNTCNDTVVSKDIVNTHNDERGL